MKCFFVALTMLLLHATDACADGGTLRASQRCGPYQVTLFTSPTILRAGPVDFSVLVQGADSAKELLDVPVMIEAYPEEEPDVRIRAAATRAGATNKLFRAVELNLLRPGRWHVAVIINPSDQPARLEAEIDVAPPLPSWIDLGLWIGWPAAVVALFGVHLGLVQRDRRRRKRPAGL